MGALGWLLNLGFAGGGEIVVTPALSLSITLDSETAEAFTLDAETAHSFTKNAETAQSMTFDVNQNP